MKKSRIHRSAVNRGILGSSNITLEELQGHVVDLHSMLGSRTRMFVPREIHDLSAIQSIIGANRCLRKLRHCDGFERHVAGYTESQRTSNFFVAVIAAYLVDRVDALVLEPAAPVRSVTPDILVEHEETRTYFECKLLQTEKYSYRREHERMFSILSQYIDVPHQVDIRYKTSLSHGDLHGLGKELEARTKLITGSGTIIHNSNLEVQVQRRDAFLADHGIRMVLEMIVRNQRENCYYPGHAFG